MHEWALAEGVIFTALKAAEKKGAGKITKIRVRVGELQQIDEEVFESALREISRRTAAEGAKIEIGREKSTLKCSACGHEWSFEESRERLGPEESEAIHFLPDIVSVYIRCPKCGSPDFRVKKGRGVIVDSIEVEA